MPQTLISAPLLSDWSKPNRDLALVVQVLSKVPAQSLEASQDSSKARNIAESSLWSSLAGMIIGLLASSGPYLAHNWTAWLAATPLLATLAAIVGVWLALVVNEANA